MTRIPGASDEMLQRILGEELYESDSSPNRPPVKKMKAGGHDLGQGIHGARKRAEFRDFLDKQIPKVGVLLLQEHHLPLDDCLNRTKQLEYRGGANYWNNALYTALGDRFSGGTGIVVGSQMAPHIIQNGVIIEGRAQYIILELGSHRIGILNLYAPNLPGQRQRFWAQLENFDYPVAEWIVGGDYNMTENAEDRSPDYKGKAMTGREEAAWNRFMIKLGVNDAHRLDEFRVVGGKTYSWRREKPMPIWARLDRFYVNATIQELGGRTGIWTTVSHVSDHAAIFIQIILDKTKSKGPKPFNTALLKMTSTLDELSQCWTSTMEDNGHLQPGEKIVEALTAVKKKSDNISEKQRREGRKKYDEQFEEIKKAEAALQADWYDLDAWDQLNQAQATLEEVRMERLDRKQFSAGANWCKMGDRCTAEFFSYHKDMKKKTVIKELMRGGQSLRSP
ncbi:hypothetical protein M758_UG200300 [Ceratodon purpureus]|nr:hypothetical protein M758_UG200300 [Ceratodon purpureus]